MSATTRQAIRVSARTPVAAVLGAAAAATAIWAVATTAGAELTVSFGSGQPMENTVVNVVVAALLGSLVGDRGPGAAYCLAHHLSAIGRVSRPSHKVIHIVLTERLLQDNTDGRMTCPAS